uniref:Uncharacterized protein n=1 Tax=Daphnia magna TaxID=35525 RepID=A0A0P6EU73_9CRUS
MSSQLFAAFTTLLSLTTCILLCQPFKILFMPSPHYELSSFHLHLCSKNAVK